MPALLLSSLLFAAQGGEFFLDDGSVDTFGGTPGGDLLVLNQFHTGSMPVIIDQISVLWNPLSVSVSPKLALYRDPNGDGNPSDCVPLLIHAPYMQPGVVILNNTTFQSYSIPPTQVSGSFFLGASLSDREFSFDPVVGVDTTNPYYPNRSWIIENNTAGALSLQNPIGTSTLVTRLETYIAGNHMIRARFTVVPEPSTATNLILALVLMMMARRPRG